MKRASRPEDLDARFQNALRSAGGVPLRGYVCPLCSTDFTAGPKLWEHAKQLHSESSDFTGPGDEIEIRKRFLDRSRRRQRDQLYVAIAFDL